MPQHLIIVESPTKAKTIGKFLGKDYRVLSSFGHVRDLPKSKTGVDTAHDFAPTYQVPPEKKDKVKELIAAASHADDVILATDEDREGEAIAWHIAEVLKLDPATAERITFHEITRPAIEAALRHPRHIDTNLVNAQQARRIVDRLVGYELSPLLWEKIRRGLSAGRVQSVAVRLIVERERERQAFRVDEYWTVEAQLSKDGQGFEAKLFAIGGRKLEKLEIKTEAQAKAIEEAARGSRFVVTAVETKDVAKAPPTPFTTSTLQIEANNRLGFGAKQTMALAQKLYETGRITYMRTDSLNLAEPFLAEAQAYIGEAFGAQNAPGARRYKTKAKGAQEAHEAIRPTDVRATPEALQNDLDQKLWKIYDLIWRRTLASQMPSAVLERVSVDLEANAVLPPAGVRTTPPPAGTNRVGFRASGHSVKTPGYLKVYRGAQEKLLPPLAKGDEAKLESLASVQHFTEPPPRYSDATIVKAMEELGIGRPSTYAPTISTIEARGYVERDDNRKLRPTDVAFTVTDLLTAHFPHVVDYAFTANMEQGLDNVEETGEWVPMLKDFYGDFHAKVEENEKRLKREDFAVNRDLGADPKTGLHVFVRTGRFGPFVQLGDAPAAPRSSPAKGRSGGVAAAPAPKPKRASLAGEMTADTVTLEQALVLLSLPRTVGAMENGDEIIANKGRFGPYLSAMGGSASGGKAVATATIAPPLSPYTITEEEARRVLAESIARKKAAATPLKQLGVDPVSGGKMLIKTGRFGAYVTDGTTNTSLGRKLAVEDVTDAIASELLEKKRHAPKRAWGRRKKTEGA